MYYSDYCETGVKCILWHGNLKCVNKKKKNAMIHDKENTTRMAARWFTKVLRATDLQWLQDTSFNVIDHELCSAFVERWHKETLNFHLPFRETTMTLDDVSCLLHLPTEGMILVRDGLVPKTEVC